MQCEYLSSRADSCNSNIRTATPRQWSPAPRLLGSFRDHVRRAFAQRAPRPSRSSRRTSRARVLRTRIRKTICRAGQGESVCATKPGEAAEACPLAEEGRSSVSKQSMRGKGRSRTRSRQDGPGNVAQSAAELSAEKAAQKPPLRRLHRFSDLLRARAGTLRGPRAAKYEKGEARSQPSRRRAPCPIPAIPARPATTAEPGSLRARGFFLASIRVVGAGGGGLRRRHPRRRVVAINTDAQQLAGSDVP